MTDKPAIVRRLDELKIDWRDFEAAAPQSRAILAEICDDPRQLSDLMKHATTREELRIMCESHQLLDYLVVYDSLERGIRLRLHLATHDHLQRPHDHRFDFSSRILCGTYEHCLLAPKLDPYSLSDELHAIAYQDKDHPDPKINMTNDDFPAAFVRNERKGDTFTLGNQVSHTVLTTANTVSLVLRGPAQKRRSFIYDRTDQKLWWRFGREDETTARRTSKTMTAEKIVSTLTALADLNVISI